jgi:hypothetical protein
MRKALLAVSFAVTLSGCGILTHSTPRFGPPPPPPEKPKAAEEPCTPTPQHRQPDGSATAGDDQATISDGRTDLQRCEEKRRMLVDAWPK